MHLFLKRGDFDLFGHSPISNIQAADESGHEIGRHVPTLPESLTFVQLVTAKKERNRRKTGVPAPAYGTLRSHINLYIV